MTNTMTDREPLTRYDWSRFLDFAAKLGGPLVRPCSQTETVGPGH